MNKVEQDLALVLGMIQQLLDREMTEAEVALATISFKSGVQTGLEWEPNPNRNN
ncbi:hypothetical protein GZH47_33455 (plasmid) [Paenibacillus rhizovicinus]|uniref:Uncharacterized protein n=1 Tax=Paenibacillus rhizovicinus TaxID=2704463 RepID=A0A6C0PCZ3_9BACL|nr:hypothetical protein [Paenibacillus rhizovicinus]QHW35802.1 hypothetical protein GZH47_33455 [Paenibacillus rhizovicinus]